VAEPLFRKIDCTMLRADDLDTAIAFYSGLGHAMIWRSEEAVAFRLPETDAELVIHRRIGPETDLLVEDAAAAYETLLKAGALSIASPFEIPIGWCAVVKDPFGNVLTILDQSKGELRTDTDGTVVGVARKAHP
jgi:catechol 2,3-dioxygenase-like lactoylglutathione lyase family enzyme